MVGTDLVAIEREGLGQVWTSALTDVAGATLDRELSSLSITAGGRPGTDTVRFTDRDAEIVDALCAWLNHVAEVNATSNNVDQLSAAQGHASRFPDLPARGLPILDPGSVVPPDASVEVAYRPPKGWNIATRGWQPESEWVPPRGAKRPKTRKRKQWSVTGPAAQVEAAADEVTYPEEWRKNGAPSRRARVEWMLTTASGRLSILNELENTIATLLWRRLEWEDDGHDEGLGLRVPPTHPVVQEREEAWSARLAKLAAARDWALHAVVTDREVSDELSAWYLSLFGDDAYADACTAVREVLSDLVDQRLKAMTPDQRHRYWWGDASEQRADWEVAESLAESVLRAMGFADAARTPPGADKGLDVVGSTVAAQVKYTAVPVGRPMLQQLRGAADGRITVFFSRSGFTRDALAHSEEAGMALFQLTLPDMVVPLNPIAQEMSNDISRHGHE